MELRQAIGYHVPNGADASTANGSDASMAAWLEEFVEYCDSVGRR
jgi:hypothetical protein